MQDKNAQELLERFNDGKCSEEELTLIQSWYNSFELHSKKVLSQQAWEEDIPEIYLVLEDHIKRQQPKKLKWYRYVAAASVLIALGVGVLFMLRKPEFKATASYSKQDVSPGGNRAFLTLSNGKKISLTTADNGKLAAESDVTVSKTADGEVTYTSEKTRSHQIQFNTLSTPLGGQFALTLSDGTKVILNAGSTLRYPTRFAGKERKVELTGEAYFEVAHNAAMPFYVASKSQNIRVLGTHFNVNTYQDEPTAKTTLLEGSVLINEKTILKPGQQAVSSGTSFIVSEVDTEVAIAWKNNKFMFEQNDLPSVMRMIARWYNVRVEYNGPISNGRFGGSISKLKNVSEVLNLLKLTGQVHFKIEERRIIVTK